MPKYVITLNPGNSRRLENWLGGQLEIGPAAAPGAALVASIEAISDEEWAVVQNRLNNDGPLYHHGGAEALAAPQVYLHHGPQPHPPPA